MAYKEKDLDALVRGDDWSLKLTATSGGSVIDITGFTFYWTFKGSVTDADPGDLQVKVIAPAGADATAGIVYLTVANATTDDMVAKTYHYDVQMIDDSSLITTLLIGKVTVVKDITIASAP